MSKRHSVALSDTGRKRVHNEDALFCDDELGFYVVADGVGGLARGEVASQTAVEQMQGWIKASRQELQALFEAMGAGDTDARWEIRKLLESGVQSACYMVFGMSELDPESRGMSTTLSAFLVGPTSCFAAHVGDSRLYRIRGQKIVQYTEDHTLINHKLRQGLITAAQAEVDPERNVITRAVGHREHVQIDTMEIASRPGDRFVLCSDGLHGYFSDEELVDLLAEGALQTGAQAAISLANHRGGKDNITVIVIEIGDDKEG